MANIQSEVGLAAHSNVVTAEQQDYSQRLYSHGSYRYQTVFPNTFGTTISIQSGQNPVTLQLPIECFNLSQSYLFMTLTIPKTGTAGQFIWNYDDVMYGLISQIQHYANTNKYIVDLNQLQNYLKVIMKKEVAFTDFLSNDSIAGFYPNNSLVSAVPAIRHDGSVSFMNYTEPAYLRVGADNADVTYNVMLPLRFIKNTLFSVDRDIYYGQLSYIKLMMGPIAKVAFASTNNANPSTGVINYPANLVPTVSNLQLFLAVQSDEGMKSALKGKFSQGLTYAIPWTYAFKNSNGNTAQNITIQFDLGSGQALNKIIHSVFNNTESVNTAYDNSNIDGAKVKTYYTQLNGRRLQDITIDCQSSSGLYTDYMQQKRMLKGSVLTSRNIYQYNWFHCDDFTEMPAVANQSDMNNVISGIPLGPMPIQWTFVGVSMANATFQHYTYAVFSKKLMVSPTMVDII